MLNQISMRICMGLIIRFRNCINHHNNTRICRIVIIAVITHVCNTLGRDDTGIVIRTRTIMHLSMGMRLLVTMYKTLACPLYILYYEYS